MHINFKEPVTILLLLLLLSLFLPWFSYGFISKSAMILPLYTEDLQKILRFFSDGKQSFHPAYNLIYLLYVYLVLVLLTLFKRNRLLLLLTALLPILFMVLLSMLHLMRFTGYGFIVSVIASLGLIVLQIKARYFKEGL